MKKTKNLSTLEVLGRETKKKGKAKKSPNKKNKPKKYIGQGR